MRAFIQRPTDGLYMRTKLEWVPEKSQARAFSSSVDALAYCIAAGLCEVRLVVSTASGVDSFLYPFGEQRNVRVVTAAPRAGGGAKLLRKVPRGKTKVSKLVPAKFRPKAPEKTISHL